MNTQRPPFLTLFIKSFMEENTQKKEFLPITTIKKYTTYDTIRKHLAEKLPSYQPQDDDLRAVVRDSSKAFLILVYCGLEHHIFGLIKSGVSDSDLPFLRKNLPQCLLALSEKQICDLLSAQWKFLAPIFSQKEYCALGALENEIILPILTKTCIGGGLSGEVYKITIATGHMGELSQNVFYYFILFFHGNRCLFTSI